MCRVAWHVNCSLRRLTYSLDSLSMTVTALLKYVFVHTMCETLDLRISCAFDGNLHALPRLRACSQCYIPPQFLRCNSGRIVFIANEALHVARTSKPTYVRKPNTTQQT